MRHLPPRIVAPPAEELRPEPADVEAATAPAIDVLAGRRTAVLTGAGISTDSGVPDYRSPGSPPRSPMTFQQFQSSATFRQHYWARNHLGWRYLRDVAPNAGHRALAELERAGVVTGVITQNIDLLHLRAGSRNVVHLHGRYDRVVCLDCGLVLSREEHDATLSELNPGWRERVDVGDIEVAPDADAVLASTADFVVADCPRCGGVLGPDVVFFGATTPPERVAAARTMVSESDALLVAGSSLAVMSGLRFVRQAAKEGKPIVVVNRGPSRGDDLASAKVEASTSRVLPLLAQTLPTPLTPTRDSRIVSDSRVAADSRLVSDSRVGSRTQLLHCRGWVGRARTARQDGRMNWSAAMTEALEEARRAQLAGDVPVGAVVVGPDGAVLATAHNRCEVDSDPTAHAEILALRQAATLRGDVRLEGCTLVVTLEPCTMCAGAIVLARLQRVVLGAWDSKAGACGSVRDVVRDARLNHRAEVIGGVEEAASAALLRDFFAARR